MKRTGRWLFLVACLALLASAAPPASAQAERRARTVPGIVVSAEGRTGACDVLRFTQGGKSLFAAGDDKVVRVWPVEAGRIDMAKGRVLRWEIWRERRGAIYAAALDKDEKRLVVGGLGAISGAVAILDFHSGDVLRSLVPAEGRTVWSLAWSPSGDRVAIGREQGDVWLWDLNTNRERRLGAHEGGASGETSEGRKVRWVSFAGEDRVLSAGAEGTVYSWDVPSGKRTKVLSFEQVSRLRCVVATPSGKQIAAGGQWAIGKEANQVEVRSLDGREGRTITLPERYFPICLAFSPDEKTLAVGTYHIPEGSPFWKITEGPVFLCSLTDTKARPIRGPETTGWPEALAFHPSGKLLAVAGGANHEVTLWDVEAGAVKRQEVAGPGRSIWGAGMSAAAPHVIGFQTGRHVDPKGPNQRGTGPWAAFDLVKLRWVSGDGFEEERVKPIANADSWTVKTASGKAADWYAVLPKKYTGMKKDIEHRLPLDPNTDDNPLCYTFLKRKPGGPVRLAVGHYWGLSIIELTETGAERVRLCTGHQGEVTTLAPSADGKWLISGSRDQTLAGWSTAEWPSGSELGARLRVVDGKVIVQKVDVGSPAWEVGLSADDEITFLVVNKNQFLYDAAGKVATAQERRGMRKIGDAAECVKRLLGAEPGKELYLQWRGPGKKGASEGATSVRHRPLWRMFPAHARSGPPDWVVWLWHSHEYATSTYGDYHIGWQVNAGIDRTPSYYRAEQFRRRFHQPLKVSLAIKGLETGQARPSLAAIEPPELRLEAAGTADERDVGKDGLTVSITARPRGNDPAQQPGDIVLWVNDHLYWRATPEKGSLFKTTLTIPVSAFRRGKNQLVLQCDNADGRGRGRAEAPPLIVNNSNKRNLDDAVHVLAVAVGDYSQARRIGGLALPDLDFTLNDADLVTRLWAAQEGLLAQKVSVTALKDEQATRDGILRELDRIKAQVKDRPDDRVVLFLAGHGMAARAERKGGKEEFDPESFAFCPWDFDRKRPMRTGVTATDLALALRQMPGRKLVLIDACHSGDVAKSNLIRELAPENVGPVIITASRIDQESSESPALGVGNGVFTYAIGKAMRRFIEADTNRDDRLSAEEISDYLERVVPTLALEVGRPIQHPQTFNPQRLGPNVQETVPWLSRRRP